jgi:hypothetical protein
MEEASFFGVAPSLTLEKFLSDRERLLGEAIGFSGFTTTDRFFA